MIPAGRPYLRCGLRARRGVSSRSIRPLGLRLRPSCALEAEEAPASAATPAASPSVPTAPAGISPVPTAAHLDLLPWYSHFPLDRRADKRKGAAFIAALAQRPDARLVALTGKGDRALLRKRPAAEGSDDPVAARATYELALLHPASAWLSRIDLAAPGAARVFLGTDADGTPYFAAVLSDTIAVAEALSAAGGAEAGVEWRSARVAGPDLEKGEAAVLAVAAGLTVRPLSAHHVPAKGSGP
jgi:hypothetical protein